MSNIPHGGEPAECSMTVCADNYVLVEEMANMQGQTPEQYLTISLKAGFVALHFYLENRSMGMATMLLTLDELPKDNDEITSYQQFPVEPCEHAEQFENSLTDVDTSLLDAEDDLSLWAFLEDDIADQSQDRVIPIAQEDAASLEFYAEVLEITPIQLANWCIYYRFILDREQAQGRHLLISSGPDEHTLLTHRAFIFPGDEEHDDE